MRSEGLVVCLVLALVGCDDEPPPIPPPSPGAVVAPPAPDDERRAEPDRPEPAPPTVDPAQRRALRDAVRAGRRAARAGDFTAADPHFVRALAIEPRSSRLRCEAGYVAFRAGELERAETQITSALGQMPKPESAPVETRRELAMCLYNAGLVYEARGRAADARTAWEQSLALRPNATVRSRLEALGNATEAEGAWTGVTLDPGGTFDQYAATLRDRWIAAGGAGFSPNGLSPDAEIDVTVQEPTGEAASGIEARLVHVTITDMGVDEQLFLVVKTPSSVRAFDAGSAYNPGAGGISNEHDVVEFAYRELTGSGPPELVLRTSASDNDEDMGVCERYGSSAKRAVLCSGDGGTIRCALLELARGRYFERYEGCEEEGRESPPLVDDREGYEVDFRIEGRDVVLERATTSPAAPPEGLIGRRPVSQVLAGEALRPM